MMQHYMIPAIYTTKRPYMLDLNQYNYCSDLVNTNKNNLAENIRPKFY